MADRIIQMNIKESDGSYSKLYPDGVILPATCTYSSGVFTLSGLPDNLPDIFTVRFKAPADFAEGDTFVIGSTTFTAKLTSQEPAPDDAFKTGAVVSVNIDTMSNKAFLAGAGGGGATVIQIDPPVGKPGMFWFNPDSRILSIWYSEAWVPVAGTAV